MTDKAIMRKIYIEKRKAISAGERKEADLKICAFLSHVEEASSCGICAYVSDGKEPDLSSFLDKKRGIGQHVYLPRALKGSTPLSYEMAEMNVPSGSLAKGAFNIPEPGEKSPLLQQRDYENMVWLVPGVAFDKTGSRLGRGKAVYDRLLGIKPRLTIGVLYECQLCESVPCEEHDVKMDMLVTEKGVVRCALKTGE
ncbi:MAG: 5-formyltetrahydrofolate cyclo-ligase [Lentisphaerae bacterium GWF2_45_14]|nr:MAG: 5-formyltetrahydrofolate cyclo-ligase [Lentisphaerae bacterium GWF2_45_14]